MSEDKLDLLSYLPPATKQTSVSKEELLNSGNAGVIIMRSGQVTNLYRNEARECALEVCEHTNKTQKGFISSYIYEETYGQQDRIYWFIHLKSLSDYMRFHRLANQDPAFGEIFMRNRSHFEGEYASWINMFPEATFNETVIVPHRWGSSGTNIPHDADSSQIIANQQVENQRSQVFHSANSRMVLMRSADVKVKHRSAARLFGRQYADYINSHCPSNVTCFMFEEHFGNVDRIHWHLNFEKYEDYEEFIEFCALDVGLKALMVERIRMDGEVSTAGFGHFKQSSIKDLLVCPQHPTKDF
ncbi:DUF6039 family protein [Endozoicomonas sp. G2_1]|uniref:DUF6039 family protein n=1 Tax=Endozoicomonas sp. G2_1 TaxID=2821091 RepID=UPI001ADA942C|nr:DUF6039 family protein [Endozoicomonas sp. G2_1]